MKSLSRESNLHPANKIDNKTDPFKGIMYCCFKVIVAEGAYTVASVDRIKN